MSGFEVDPDELIDIGEMTLPYAADFYDEMANRVGAVGAIAGSGLITTGMTASPAGNALGEAIIRCHRFLYAVIEDTADSHRAVAASVLEAGREYQEAENRNQRDFEMAGEDLADSVAGQFERVDAGDYKFSGEYAFNNFDSAKGGSGYEEALSGKPQKPVDPEDYQIRRPTFNRNPLNDRYGFRPPVDELEKD